MKKLEIKNFSTLIILSILVTLVSIYMFIPHFIAKEKISDLVVRMNSIKEN